MLATNASVIKLTGASAATGGRDDFEDAVNGVSGDADRPGGIPPVKWQGPPIRAFLRLSVGSSFDPATGTRNAYTKRELILNDADVALLGIDTDDVITVDPDDAPPFDSRAQAIPRSTGLPVSAGLRTCRIRLEDA